MTAVSPEPSDEPVAVSSGEPRDEATSDPHEDDSDEAEPSPDSREPRRARWPLVLFVLGALAVGAAFERTAPRARTVRVRLQDAATVVGVEATWFDGEGDLLGASRWSFAPGRAPGRVDAELRLRRGQLLRAEVRVVRDGGVESRHDARATVESEELVSLELP